MDIPPDQVQHDNLPRSTFLLIVGLLIAVVVPVLILIFVPVTVLADIVECI